MIFQSKYRGRDASFLRALSRYVPCIFLLSLCSFVSAAPVKDSTRKVYFTAADGMRIIGVYRPPASRKKHTFVLLHGLGSTKEEWEPFERYLEKEGYGFLAYDARGHGESIAAAGGTPMRYDSFGHPGPGSPWEKMKDDLGLAVRFLEREYHIRPERLVLTGASLGANVCLIYAAATPAVTAVIALSPGLDYAGFRPSDCLPSLADRRIALVAAPGDPFAYQSAQYIHGRLRAYGRIVFIEGKKGHGVQMFNGELEQKLLQWVGQ